MDIWKEALLGFVILKRIDFADRRSPYEENRREAYVDYLPLSQSWDELDSEDNPFAINEDEGETIMGIISAPPNSFKVWACGEVDGDEAIMLGYEFPGAAVPEWEKRATERIAQARRAQARAKNKS